MLTLTYCLIDNLKRIVYRLQHVTYNINSITFLFFIFGFIKDFGRKKKIIFILTKIRVDAVLGPFNLYPIA